jgi:hypothetical protein
MESRKRDLRADLIVGRGDPLKQIRELILETNGFATQSARFEHEHDDEDEDDLGKRKRGRSNLGGSLQVLKL